MTTLTSWVSSANGHSEFPLQNLPLGIFSRNELSPRGGVAIGDFIFDLHAALDSNLFSGAARDAAQAACGPTLNNFFKLGAAPRQALRQALLQLLASNNPQRNQLESLGDALLHPAAECRMQMPASVGDYTDFYTGIHHAVNVGKLYRPDNPLLPNYKYVPIGYHGRASTIHSSGAKVHRPNGQTLAPGASTPTLGPCKKLDYELEVGIWIGPGNNLGEPISIECAADSIAGYCLLNDWSARDLQAWEYQPLGPFLAKSFITTVSPWVVTPEALEPFRRPQPPRPDGDPQPLPYLFDAADQKAGALDIELEVLLLTAQMKAENIPAQQIGLSNSLFMYWTPAQLVTHHSVNGCQLQSGDLLGTGTLSGPGPEQAGSLLEKTLNGQHAITLSNGETRTFLEDGDEVIIRARCVREGVPSIGFGECRGQIQESNR